MQAGRQAGMERKRGETGKEEREGRNGGRRDQESGKGEGKQSGAVFRS